MRQGLWPAEQPSHILHLLGLEGTRGREGSALRLQGGPTQKGWEPSWEEEGRRLRKRREAAGAVIYKRSNPLDEGIKPGEGVVVSKLI